MVVLAMAVTCTEGFARGGRGSGSRGGGQQRMGNASGASQYGYGGQMGAVQQQMMIQNRYRMMQSQSGLANGNMQQQRLRDGSGGGQGSSGQDAVRE